MSARSVQLPRAGYETRSTLLLQRIFQSKFYSAPAYTLLPLFPSHGHPHLIPIAIHTRTIVMPAPSLALFTHLITELRRACVILASPESKEGIVLRYRVKE